MKKIISFSLWGDNPKYTQGALENILLRDEFYSDWTCRFYCHISVPLEIKNKIKNSTNCELIIKQNVLSKLEYKTNGIHMGWFWRFEVLNDLDVERFIVRDIDSRLSLREKNCVIDWGRSKKIFHIIRDHPMHEVPILAGTWGATKEFSQSINYKDILEKFLIKHPINNSKYGGYDQFFLSTVFYPLIKDNACIHDDWNRYNEGSRKIPHIRNNNEFIGQPIELI